MTNQSLTEVAAALTSASLAAVMAGPASSTQPGGAIAALRASSSANQVSSVDDADADVRADRRRAGARKADQHAHRRAVTAPGPVRPGRAEPDAHRDGGECRLARAHTDQARAGGGAAVSAVRAPGARGAVPHSCQPRRGQRAWLLTALAGPGTARAAYAALKARPPGGEQTWTRTNHRGEPVTLLEGPAAAAGAVAAVALSPGVPGPGARGGRASRALARRASVDTTTWRVLATGGGSVVT